VVQLVLVALEAAMPLAQQLAAAQEVRVVQVETVHSLVLVLVLLVLLELLVNLLLFIFITRRK
jgi:hypothetical protein